MIGTPPEFELVVGMLVSSLIIFNGAMVMSHYEKHQTPRDDFRFHLYRGIAGWQLFMMASSLSSICARLLHAHVVMVGWPWLGLMYWASLQLGIMAWLLFRIESRIRKHPFWPDRPA